jgi:hypothetical protein
MLIMRWDRGWQRKPPDPLLSRRALTRRGRRLRLRRISLGLCLSRVRFFRGALAL